jgi:hypothetical protein
MALAGRPGLHGTPLAPPGLLRTVAIAHRKDVVPTRAAHAFQDTLETYLAAAASSAALPAGVEPLVPR